jgi:hypothetical protein
MAAFVDRDTLRFPPALSAQISSELEAIAWNESDLPRVSPCS